MKTEIPIVDFSYRLEPRDDLSEKERLFNSIGIMGEHAESVLECVSLAFETIEDGSKFMGAIEAALYEIRDMRATLNLLYPLVRQMGECVGRIFVDI